MGLVHNRGRGGLFNRGTNKTVISNWTKLKLFITTWDTEKAGSATKTIVIPTTGSGYNCGVDWGDGTIEKFAGIAPVISHVYATTGIKTIKIAGAFPRIYFNDSGDCLKLMTIEQWGKNKWSSMEGAFYGCQNLTGNYTDYPDTSLVTSMKSMFGNCYLFNSAVNFNTSEVTTMEAMFGHCHTFNQSLASFNTAKVTDMRAMFAYCWLFNQSVSNFDTSEVTTMGSMFVECVVFNQSVANFNTAKVTTMTFMFSTCQVFNQSIAAFDTSNVTDMSYMFNRCYAFNQPVTTLNTSKVTTMAAMFAFCTNFNRSTASFDVTQVTTMDGMFAYANNLSTANYDDILISYSAQAVKNSVLFHGGDAKYTAGGAAEAGRSHLILAVGSGGHGWTITDGGAL